MLEKLLARCTRPEAFRKKIKKNIAALKVNSASAKPVNAVRTLSKDLAKIVGAFAADGSLSVQLILAATTQQPLEKLRANLGKTASPRKVRWSSARKQYYVAIQLNEHSKNLLEHLDRYAGQDLLTQTHYVVELTDEYEDSVRAFATWIKAVFGIEPTSLNIKRGKRAWRVIFSNKIVARYLTEFFGMESGQKTYTVCEPDTIKNSKLDTRRNFARGALMFDGCVTKGGKITFSSKSKDFATSIQDIWTQDEIAHGTLARNRRGEYAISTVTPNSMHRLLNYFEPNTQKWKLLRWINGDKNVKPVIKETGGISANKILDLLAKIKSCDIKFLEEHFQRRYTTIGYYLNILKNQKKIKISNKPTFLSTCTSEQTSVQLEVRAHNTLFLHSKEKFGYYKNVANILGIHKATFSAWRVRKSRISISTLRNLCSLLDIDFSTIASEITKTDRGIVELI